MEAESSDHEKDPPHHGIPLPLLSRRPTSTNNSIPEMTADLSNLPNEILFSIAMRTEHLSDYIRFGAVCNSWRSAITENPRPPHLGFPLLFMSRETISNNRHDHFLYSPFERKLHPVRLPDRSRPERCLGSSSDGWLCMVDDGLDIYLLNPFSNAVVLLPPFRTNFISKPRLDSHGSSEILLHPGDDIRKWLYSGEYARDLYMHKAVWSLEPTDPHSIIVVICQKANCLMYCRPEDRQWSVFKTSLSSVSDAIFIDEKLYVVDSIAQVAAVDLFDEEQEMLILESNGLNLVLVNKPYLAASPSGLLLIVRLLDMLEEEEDIYYLTGGFRLFKMNERAPGWVEVNSLGDGLLFLGQNMTMWQSANNFKECKANAIYFTDDNFMDVGCLGWGEDSGIFYLEDGSFDIISDNLVLPGFLHPIWVVPNP